MEDQEAIAKFLVARAQKPIQTTWNPRVTLSCAMYEENPSF